jgi:hypothetical protein
VTTPPPTSQTPAWSRPRGGPPEPGSALDEQFAAFIGPRWERYRGKFAPFYDDARFQPTWNWAAALTAPFGAAWFLYRKLYVPFVFFVIVPGIAFGLLWGGDIPFETVPNPLDPAAPPVNLPTPEARLVLLGVTLSALILAGGTANYLLYRRAAAAIHLIAPRAPEPTTRLMLLRRVGGVSWVSVAVGIVMILLLQFLAAGAGSGSR